MSMTNYSENIVNGGITLTNLTGETVDISYYPDFGFHEKLRFKDNHGRGNRIYQQSHRLNLSG